MKKYFKFIYDASPYQGGEMGRTCSTYGRDKKCIQHFDRGRPRRRWEDNIRMVKVKVQVNLPPRLNRHHTMKTCCGVET